MDVDASPAAAAPRLPSVSVIIPARNAEATIARALNSVLSQDYAGSVEVIVADGSDTPAMAEVVQRQYPMVKLVSNPERFVGFGIEAALRIVTGEIIMRCDAHSVLPPGYVRCAVETLERTGAANVGGRQYPVGTTFFERAVAIAMTTTLGSGGSRYRIGGLEGPVDTVYLGMFRREVLDAVGGYNATLVRNQDYELNWRLRQHGKTVWFNPELVIEYQPRGTLRALARQYFDYGRWKRVMLLLHPASMRVRQLIAPLLVLGLAASLFLALAGAPWEAAAALPLAYLFVLTVGSLAIGIHRRAPAALLLPLVLATMHLSWGIGFFLPTSAQGGRS